MKLLIEIDDFTLNECKNAELNEYTQGPIFHALKCIANGKSLDAVLDEIKGGIEKYEADCRLICPNDDCSRCDDVTFGSIYKIIDKYKAESEDKG